MTATLITALEHELNWLTNKLYTSEPHYQALLDAIQDIPDYHADQLPELSTQLLGKFQALSLHIGQKFKSLIDLSINEINHLHERVAQLQQQVRGLKDTVQTLQQTRQAMKNKVAEWEQQFQSLKAQASEMQIKYQHELRLARKEKKEIKRTFLQVQEDTEQDRKLLEDMHIEKLEISQQILNQKETKQSLLQEIEILKRHLNDSEKKASASATKVQYEERQIKKLEEELEAKNRIIQQLYQSQRLKDEVESVSAKNSDSGKLQLPEEVHVNGQVVKKVSFAQKFRLGQEVLMNEDFDLQYRRSSSAKNSLHSEPSPDQVKLNDLIIEQEMYSSRVDSSRKIQPNTPNIYFCHYQLTVQAVKLKMNRLQVLDIDLANKTQYYNLLNEAVPFHHWDTWIQMKLRRLASLNN